MVALIRLGLSASFAKTLTRASAYPCFTGYISAWQFASEPASNIPSEMCTPGQRAMQDDPSVFPIATFLESEAMSTCRLPDGPGLAGPPAVSTSDRAWSEPAEPCAKPWSLSTTACRRSALLTARPEVETNFSRISTSSNSPSQMRLCRLEPFKACTLVDIPRR